MQKVLSPSPKALYRPNCPVVKLKASPSLGSANSRRKVRTEGASSVMAAIFIKKGL